jgi:DSF synthase
MGAIDFGFRQETSFTGSRVYGDRVRAELIEGLQGALSLSLIATPGVRHSFTLETLGALESVFADIGEGSPAWPAIGAVEPLKYMVIRSEHADAFSLGGDLEHFSRCIKAGDRQGLHAYAMRCLDLMYGWATRWNGALTTIALVQGRALGGGFETALSADYIVAEEQSTFSFPEILFGLFPCTGGMGLLARRVGVHQAERMMTNGRIYTAAELLEMGVVDEVCPSGTGLTTVHKFVRKHARHGTSRLALQRSRYRLAPLDYADLRAVVDDWADAAMALRKTDLAIMEQLLRMQQAHSGGQGESAPRGNLIGHDGPQ